MDAPTPGRIVRYVLESGDYRPAMVVESPGLLASRFVDYGEPLKTEHAAPDSGVIGCAVYLVPGDLWDGEPVYDIGVYAPGAPHDPTGQTPHTWHWPARA